MTKNELFLKLASPNKEGVSRWVSVTEFIGEFSPLVFGNGGSWARKEGTLAKKYKIEFDKSITPGNSIDRIKLAGFNNNNFTQGIKQEIKSAIKKMRCLVLGTTNPEVDHKNGMKNDKRVMNKEGQRLEDFQPLSRAANDAKRQFCKDCKKTHKRFDAKILGYPMSFYAGEESHNDETTSCVGCFWYDVAEFRRHLKEKE